MTIGLVMLGILSILIFFGVSEKFFRKIGISNWLAFLLVLALVVGAVVPGIKIGKGFSLNIGGFLVPLVLTVVFCVLIGWNSDLTRSMVALLGVAGVTIATRMLISPDSFATIITASIIVGFVGGIVAYLVGVTRLSTLIAAIGGIVLGDIFINIVNRFILHGATFALGSSGVFDSIIIAAVTGIVLLEAVGAIKRTMNRGRVSKGALNMEAGEDADFTVRDVSTIVVEEDYSDYFDDDVNFNDDEKN